MPHARANLFVNGEIGGFEPFCKSHLATVRWPITNRICFRSCRSLNPSLKSKVGEKIAKLGQSQTSNAFCVQKVLGPKQFQFQNFGSKRFWGNKNLRQKQYWAKKKFEIQKMLGSTKFWVKIKNSKKYMDQNVLIKKKMLIPKKFVLKNVFS